MKDKKPKYGNRPGDIIFTKPSLTRQSFKDEVDINAIIKRYETTGMLPTPNQRTPQYGDYSNPIDFQSAQNIIIRGQEQFDSLPSKVRRQFNDNPVDFLAFATNPENLDAMVEMGLLDPSLSTRSPDTHGDPVVDAGGTKTHGVKEPEGD